MRWIYWVWSVLMATVALTALHKLYITGDNLYGLVFLFLSAISLDAYAESMDEFERKEK